MAHNLINNMYINGDSIDLDSYNIYVTNVRINVDPMEAYLEMSFTVQNTEHLAEFFGDLNIINSIRNSKAPAVQNAYDGLLTLLALTNTTESD